MMTFDCKLILDPITFGGGNKMFAFRSFIIDGDYGIGELFVMIGLYLI